MSDLVLVDTSAWIHFFRKGEDAPDVADEIQRLIVEERAGYTEPVLVELIAGARSVREVRELRAKFSLLQLIELEGRIWESAADNAFLLRGKGTRVPLADILIATATICGNATLLHHDSHFKKMSQTLPLREYSFLGD